MKLHPTLERLLNAVTEMASSSKPLRERLLSASLTFHAFRDEELPEEARDRYRSLIDGMSAGGTRSFEATLATTSDDEVQALAKLLCEILDAVVYTDDDDDEAVQ